VIAAVMNGSTWYIPSWKPDLTLKALALHLMRCCSQYNTAGIICDNNWISFVDGIGTDCMVTGWVGTCGIHTLKKYTTLLQQW